MTVDDARSDDADDGLSPAVARRVARMWPVEEDRRRVRAALATYGTESHEGEQERVRLAILKLAEGDAAQLPALVATAKRDYRDVLMWAEYPEQGRATWAWRANLTQADQDRLRELRRRDREQYEAWLRASGE
jgi:hypothetical protein